MYFANVSNRNGSLFSLGVRLERDGAEVMVVVRYRLEEVRTRKQSNLDSHEVVVFVFCASHTHLLTACRSKVGHYSGCCLFVCPYYIKSKQSKSIKSDRARVQRRRVASDERRNIDLSIRCNEAISANITHKLR